MPPLIGRTEMIVTVGKEKGMGGRNQEYVLAAAQHIAGSEHIVMGSVDTDGTDGPGKQFTAEHREVPVLNGGIVDGSTAIRARALGIDLSPTAAMAILPVVLMVQIVPLGVGGLGLREGALVVFLAPLGIAATQAVILGLAIHLLGATVGLLGAPSLASAPARPYLSADDVLGDDPASQP